MSELKIVNATGLACPQPVVLAKEAIEKNEKVKVIVDNETALENVTRLGNKLGCDVKSETKAGGCVFEITLSRPVGSHASLGNVSVNCTPAPAASGPFVVVCAEDKMGRGNDELGAVLMRSFLHTLCEQKEKPQIMIFYNTGVRLTLQNAQTLEDLQTLAAAGVEILVCGTCLNFFAVKDQLSVGIVSNMYDIAETMSSAARLLML